VLIELTDRVQSKQIKAGFLDIGYCEAGPSDGQVVLLLHGYPYDIHCMSYKTRYDTRIPGIDERLQEFLRAEHLTGQVEHEFEPGNVNKPTGWATLTVDTSDPRLCEELESFISALAKVDEFKP